MPKIADLVAVAVGPLSEDTAVLPPRLAGLAPALSSELLGLLRQKNGFFIFDQALHVFPSGRPTAGYDLETWNDDATWRSHYGRLAEGLLFFAEDIFGVQFALRGADVCRFDPESAEITIVANTLNGWAAFLLADAEVETGYPLAQAWQAVHGPIQATERLMPRTLFAMGGEFSVDNLKAVDAIHGMRFRGEIAQHVHNLPPGATVRFDVT